MAMITAGRRKKLKDQDERKESKSISHTGNRTSDNQKKNRAQRIWRLTIEMQTQNIQPRISVNTPNIKIVKEKKIKNPGFFLKQFVLIWTEVCAYSQVICACNC